jgi:DNA-binding CsgD family transcriptional regulator
MSRRGKGGDEKGKHPDDDDIRQRAVHPSRFAWPGRLAALLGRMTDTALASRAGLSHKTVEAERRRRGIPAFTEKRPPVRWTPAVIALLGKIPDEYVAKELGVNSHTVNMKRRMLGISPYGTPHSSTYEWTKRGLALLGKKSDTEVMRALAISRNTVRVKRRALGISARGKGRVRWTREMSALLGKTGDKELGRRFGLSASAVAAERMRRGIRSQAWRNFPLARGPELRKLLKTHSATELLERYGIGYTTTSRLRAELAIPAPPRRRKEGRRESAYFWTAEEKALLGKMSDKEVAERVGVTPSAAKRQRLVLGIPALPRSDYHQWTAEELSLIGRLKDREVAARVGVSIRAVGQKRRRLGVPPPPRIELAERRATASPIPRRPRRRIRFRREA